MLAGQLLGRNLSPMKAEKVDELVIFSLGEQFHPHIEGAMQSILDGLCSECGKDCHGQGHRPCPWAVALFKFYLDMKMEEVIMRN